MAYIGNRIICPACNTPSDDDDYCTTCGEVFAQFDDEQLKREGGQAKGVIDAVDVVKYECPYCGKAAEFGRVYIPRDMAIYFENTFCPECGVRMMPIYQRTEEDLPTNKKNNMEVQGKIEKVLPIQSGTSANGAWRRQDFIVNYFEQPSDIYYRRIVLGVMNDRIDELKLKAGDEIKARYEIRVNEWNGRVFNDVRTGHIEVLKRSVDDVATQSQQTGQQEQQAAAQAPQPAAEENKEDDLPF